jgi:hypothetical protein
MREKGPMIFDFKKVRAAISSSCNSTYDGAFAAVFRWQAIIGYSWGSGFLFSGAVAG